MLKSLVSVLSFAMLLAVGACGGDDDADAAPPDAAAVPDAAGQPDSTPEVTAESLGVPCPGGNECPTGYTCTGISIGTTGNATGAFCTLPCTVDPQCANGYTGPGQPACVLGDGMGGMSCAILCTAGAPDCPAGDTCQDVTGQTGEPDGNPDVCAPPGA